MGALSFAALSSRFPSPVALPSALSGWPAFLRSASACASSVAWSRSGAVVFSGFGVASPVVAVRAAVRCGLVVAFVPRGVAPGAPFVVVGLSVPAVRSALAGLRPVWAAVVWGGPAPALSARPWVRPLGPAPRVVAGSAVGSGAFSWSVRSSSRAFSGSVLVASFRVRAVARAFSLLWAARLGVACVVRCAGASSWSVSVPVFAC